MGCDISNVAKLKFLPGSARAADEWRNQEVLTINDRLAIYRLRVSTLNASLNAGRGKDLRSSAPTAESGRRPTAQTTISAPITAKLPSRCAPHQGKQSSSMNPAS